MDMVSEGYRESLQQSLEEGRIPLSDIDRACPPGARSEIQVGTFRRSLPLLRSAARRHADLYARTPRRGAPYRGRELRVAEKRRRRAAAPARGNDRRGRPAGRFAREHARHVERRYRSDEAADARRRVAAGGRRRGEDPLCQGQQRDPRRGAGALCHDVRARYSARRPHRQAVARRGARRGGRGRCGGRRAGRGFGDERREAAAGRRSAFPTCSRSC